MAKPIPVRGAVAAAQLSIIQLLEAAGVTESIELDDLSVNVNFRAGRIDIARLSEDGQHLGEWLCGFSINPHDLSEFGTRVGLPGMDKQTH
jgi:hypothetical protein